MAGSSAGAINAALLALGYSSKEVSEIIAKTDFSSFEDSGNFISDVFRVIKKYGWNKGNAFLDFIEDKIKKKTGSENFTFGELEEAIRDHQDGFRYLYVASTNLSKQRIQLFSHEHTPEVRIADAVRMSMSIPLYFKAVKRNNDILVDGGVSYNYPINLFDSKKYVSNEKNLKIDKKKNGYEFNYETLGFRLDSKEIIEYAEDDWALPPQKITNIKKYSLSLVDYMMEMANRAHLKPDDWNRTIFIDTLGVKTTDFQGVKTRIPELIKSGEDAVKNYFNWRDNDKVWSSIPV